MNQYYPIKYPFADLKFPPIAILLIFVILGIQNGLAEVPPLIPSPQRVEWNNQKFSAQGSITLISSLKSDHLITRQVSEILNSQGATINQSTNNKTIKGKAIIFRTIKNNKST